MRVIVCLLVILLWVACAKSVAAHAVLARSEPTANAALAEAPTEIRLWFTEPLEPRYSGFELRDMTGAVVQTATSQSDESDPHQMFMQPGTLPAGLYTVAWWNTSAADGHRSEGSFPFTIGAAISDAPPAPVVAETIPLRGAIVRWINLLSLALAVGSLGFVHFVWRPAMTERYPVVEGWLQAVVWVGWASVGISGLLLLIQQAAIMRNVSLGLALDLPALLDIVTHTRFGLLWWVRMLLWITTGVLLLIARMRPAFGWTAMGGGFLLLLLHSLYSHAAATPLALPAVAADWIHLCMTALWLGGLLPFLLIIFPLRRAVQPVALLLGRLVGFFSNYARIAVSGLMVTGLYASWLHVGTVDGLTSTLYGRTLLVKLLMMLPLLAIAGINLVWTHRRLLAGQEIWVGRLRGLIGAELVLAVAILAMVGIMTSINPARNELAVQAAASAAPVVPPPQPFDEMQMIDDLHVQLTITPGWVGVNTFAVALSTMDGVAVTNASLIRLRFNHQTEDMGESELRIEGGTDGVYQVSGANLSAPGDWQMRMTVQRPNQFDSVLDFVAPIDLPPPALLPAPTLEVSPVLPYQTEALLSTGLLALAFGGYFLGQQRFRFWRGIGLLASLLVGLGSVLVASGVLGIGEFFNPRKDK